jgi:hypothetical protein
VSPHPPEEAAAAIPLSTVLADFRIMEEFGGLRWAAVQPKHLGYKNAEVLFIGEKSFPHEGDHEGTADELSLLEEEDEKRVGHLKGGTAQSTAGVFELIRPAGDESVFADLELNKKEFVGVQTTWG